MTDRLVIFLHLPKTAGSTLNRVIAQQYPPEDIHKLGGKPPDVVAREVAEITRPSARPRLISGHLGFGVHATAACDFTYITVLREPIERLLSHFYFARKLPEHPQHDDILSGRLTLAGTAELYANLQTRSLADPSVRGANAAPADTLASAKENLARYFSVVGLAEHFDETLVLLERNLGWKVRPFASSNVNRDRPDHTAHTAEELAPIRAANALDLELYAWARERFEAERAGLGVRAATSWLRLRTRAAGLRQKLASLRPGAAT